ncbi:MAG: efflux RND transporter permease subunit [Betaproteobacteria bacterium]
MFRLIVATSLRFRFLVLGAAATLVALGAAQLPRMPVDVFPEFAPPIVEVQTEAIGLSAEEVESLITYGLEELLTGVPWLESTRSASVTGLSSITLIFQRGTDVIRARQMVQERLALAYTLPNVATPPVILQPLSATSRVMTITIASDTIEPTELSLLARWTIKPRLAGVPGVANVAIWGQRLRQLHVQIAPDRLREAGLTQEDVVAAAGDALWVSPLTFLRASSPGSGGWIDNANQRLGVEHAMPIETPEDLAKVPVAARRPGTAPTDVTLGDIAEITFAHPPLIGDAVVGGGDGLVLVVEKFPSANTLEVTRDVDRALAELSRGLPGVRIDSSAFRLAAYVDDAIENLSFALVAGALLVAAVLALLFPWRAALVGAVSIPLALAAAVLVLKLAGATINTMMLAGLAVALGVVIDDAIAGVGAIASSSSGGVDAPALVDAVVASRATAGTTAAIVTLAVMPVFAMGGVAGAFFEPLAVAYLLAVAASMLVALTVAPALAAVLPGRPASTRARPIVAWLAARHAALLARAMTAPTMVAIAAIAFALAAVAVFPLLGQTLLPPLAEQDVVIDWRMAPGTSQAESSRIAARVCRELGALPGVRHVGAEIGRAVTGDRIVGVNASRIWVRLDPSADRERTLATVRETLGGYPGVEHSMHGYLRNKVSEALTGQPRPVVVRVYGPRRDVLHEKAEEVRLAMAAVPGITDLQVDGEVSEPQIQVTVDLDAAARAGVKPGDVRRASATVFSGIVAGYLFRDQKIFEVVVWGAPETRHSLANLAELWIERPGGAPVRLRDVASLSIAATPTVIRHERIAPYVDVVANVAGRDPRAVADEVASALERVAFPLEYHPELLGEYAERQSAQNRTIGVMVATLIGIVLLLQAALRSWRLAAVATLPPGAAWAGATLAALAGGGTLSLGSVVGFLALLGVAAWQGLVVLDRYRRGEEHEGRSVDDRDVVRGTVECMPAIIASSVATIAALVPLMARGPVAGLEIVQPMAIVVAGGVAASTIGVLFVLPVVYRTVRPRAPREPDPGLHDAAPGAMPPFRSVPDER